MLFFDDQHRNKGGRLFTSENDWVAGFETARKTPNGPPVNLTHGEPSRPPRQRRANLANRWISWTFQTLQPATIGSRTTAKSPITGAPPTRPSRYTRSMSSRDRMR